MSTLSLLYSDKIEINDKITVVIPKVGQIIDNIDEYYDIVYMLTAMPIDMMVQLDDLGIDFSTINEYELFLILFAEISKRDTSLILGDLDLSQFTLAVDEANGNLVLIDPVNDIKIDRSIHNKIASALRKLHNIEKNMKKPGNEEAKKYMIERARKKLKRKKPQQESQLESLIVAMVNTEQYKYDFEGTRELSIYQFNECVRQIIKKVDYDNRMYGVYAGTVSVKDLSQDDLTWLTHK